jgi:hypothetical protein
VSVIDNGALERAIQRNGNELYQLALLLTPDRSSAARSLLSATRQLALAKPAIDEATLIGALSAALPEQRRTRRPRRSPAWVQRSPQPQLLAALARLPREQVLALGLSMLRAYEPAQVAMVLGGDEASVRAQLRDALLALVPHADLEQAAQLDALAAPDECRPTRAALALDEARLHNDPALRSHLALCGACRAAEQAWLKLTSIVEEALRGALRGVRLPDDLAEQLQAAARPPAASARARLLADARVRIALVMLPVLALIAVLVWPRGALEPSAGANKGAASGPAPAPRELVRRAQAQLYLPPEGRGIWHSTYTIQWVFASNNAAPLTADEWIDPASGRHRLQLVHQAGGGPYEYELADTPDSIWYAISQVYRPSIYMLSPYEFANLVHLRVSAEQRQQMLQARLQSGAWDIAANYLRQAAGADLHAWGRQRDADGRLIDLVSFAGVSPLALPPDAPTATTSLVTVLLAIDEESGRLREVRELLGESGSEQTTRTTWRVVNEEWLDDVQAIDRVFEQNVAWNGVGTFIERTALVQPALPLIDGYYLMPLARIISEYGPLVRLLATPPPNTNAAVLINPNGAASDTDGRTDLSSLAFVYLGANRQLELFSTFADLANTPLIGAEITDLDGQQLMIRPGVGQVYQAQLTLQSDYGGPPPIIRIGARGYTRAELLALLHQLRPATLEAYRAQVRLFADPFPRTPAFDALIGALDRATPDGTVGHTVERITSRQDGVTDQLPDPYHRPRYDGQSEQIFRESWRRGTIISDTFEVSATIRNGDQAIIARQYSNAAQSWNYLPALGELTDEASNALFQQIWSHLDRRLIVHMLMCGSGQIQTNADGTRTVFLSSRRWKSGSCQYMSYSFMLRAQTSAAPNEPGDLLPYLADIADDTLTSWIDLDAAGQAIRAEVRAGTQRSGTLVEGWQLVSSELLPAVQVPPTVFNPAPPPAIIRWQNDSFSFPSLPTPHEIAITDTLALVRTPLFALAETITGTAGTATPPGLAPMTIYGIELPIPPHPRWLYTDRTPFEGAVLDGYALRVTSRLGVGADRQDVDLYEGEAARFGAYLRSLASWRTSAPVTLQIGGKSVNGWQVMTTLPSPELWTLFDLDGTLVTVRAPTPTQLDTVLAQLQPVERP